MERVCKEKAELECKRETVCPVTFQVAQSDLRLKPTATALGFLLVRGMKLAATCHGVQLNLSQSKSVLMQRRVHVHQEKTSALFIVLLLM